MKRTYNPAAQGEAAAKASNAELYRAGRRRLSAKETIAYQSRRIHAMLEKEIGHLRQHMTDLERLQLEQALLRLDTLHELTEGRTIS